MTSIEIVAFATLWTGFLTLAALVLLLYTQVERAYQQQPAPESGGLAPGAEAPDVEIVTRDGPRLLAFPPPEDRLLVAFISGGCDACVGLLNVLADPTLTDIPRLALVNGETTDELRRSYGEVRLEWLAHPPDVTRHFGVVSVPTIYVLSGRTVLASRVTSSRAGVQKALAEAEQRFASGPLSAASAASA
jgi:hypothetical protein